MKKILKKLNELDQNSKMDMFSIRIFADGSGRLFYGDEVVADFDKLKQLKKILNNCIFINTNTY